MPFTGTVVCTSFYYDLFLAKIDSSAHTFRLALYTNAATLDKNTTAYTATNELPTALGYTAGGVAVAVTLSTVSTPGGDRVVVDFANASWAAATFSGVRGALLYDDTAAGNPAMVIIDFGMDKAWPASDPVTFPDPTANAGFFVLQTILSS